MSKTRFFLVETKDDRHLVKVRPEDEEAWAGTRRYLADAGVSLKIEEVAPVSPAAISDLLAGRDL